MFKRRNPRNLPIETLVSARTHVEGDVTFAGGLQIEGRVTGNVLAQQGEPSRLVLGGQALVEGSVVADVVEVHGTVRGGILAPVRVVLSATAHVEGGLQYGSIEMAAGALIDGRLVKLENAGT
ncbi:MAG: polymer-forming cytoskeletal protein [Nevskiaceae bacterium]|jgi:cytoskeletal protein CcmA (bactofilin family)|nr:polymer-forming cytoskeletal protein [Nevskiaceae bacterium]